MTRVTCCLAQMMVPFFPSKTLVKLDQRFQTLCKTKKSLYPALPPNGLSEHTNLVKKKSGAIGVQEYSYMADI